MNVLTEEEIFAAAIQKPVSERAAFLERVCNEDASLRRQVEALLAAHDQPDSLLQVPTADVTVDSVPRLADRIGARIGPYKLLQQLGEGGMGSVYLAEQQQPVKRQVALKIIKAGMDTAQVIARFEQERQALAIMEHPNIAKVLDAGTTESGRPYFVMELVKGIPITRYCDQEHLTPNERLGLFIPVCQAVQHAHQKGIIHRDLKPSNVLIALYDGQPVPKVIDFGVAKATSQKLTERTLFTEVGSIVGTLEYMAPEQAELNNLDIDTRADIYSLGVLLYELLAGAPPFSNHHLKSAGYNEMLRIIKEVEPLKPSTKLSASVELPSIAANRKLEPKRLTRLIRGDLDWIVMKCLEKERARRYETANGFALDIQRYLDEEPVLAGPPSASYRLKKFLQRHKGPMLAAMMVALAMVTGVVVSIWQAVRATRAETAALVERDSAEQARAEEAQQRQQALAARAAEAEQRQRAESARDATERALTRAEGLRLTAQSSAILPTNPGLSLVLAVDGAEHYPGRLANNALLAALDACYEERTLLGHKAPVRSAAFSPDGRRVLSLTSYSFDDSTIRVWDAATGQFQFQLIPFAFHNREAVISPDGRRIVTRYEGKTMLGSRSYSDEVLYLWDAATGKPLFLLRGHQDWVTSMAFSPDSNHLLTASWDHTARIWDVATGKELQVLKDPTAALCAARFSRDGQHVLTICDTPQVSRYGSGSPRATKNDEPEPAAMRPITKADFGGWGGGSTFYGTLEPGSFLAHLWDAATGKEISGLKQNPLLGKLLGRPTDGIVSPDGRLVLVRDDTTVVLWEPATDRILARIQEPSMLVNADFSPDGKRVLTAFGRTTCIRDATTGEILRTMEGHTRPLVAAVFSPDGRWIATASEDMTCRVWDVETGTEFATFKGHEERVNSVAFSPDSQRVVTASEDKTVRIWQVQPPREFARTLTGHQGPLHALAFSPDGRRLVTTSDDKTARLWDVTSGQEVGVLKGHAELRDASIRQQVLGPVRAAQFSPDGKRLVTAGDEVWSRIQSSFLGLKLGEKDIPFTPARLWDAETGKELIAFRADRSGFAFVQFSPDGKRLLAAENGHVEKWTPNERSTNTNADRVVRIWNAETGEPITVLKESGPDWQVTMNLISASFSLDSQRVLTSWMRNDGRCLVYLWDAATGKKLLQLKLTSEELPWYILFSSDGERLLGFRPGKARAWDATTGQELARFDELGQDKTGGQPHLAMLSPDGRRAVAISTDHACVWDLEAFKPLFLLEGHRQAVHSAAFSPDGQLIVTASDDETARLWDAATGQERYTLSGHRGSVRSAVFSPDGHTVATASADGTVRLWQVDPLPTARARRPRDLTPAERKQFEIGAAASSE